MLHGKKGFDRLVSACQHVLTKSITWLFCRLSEGEQCARSLYMTSAKYCAAPAKDPLEKYFPVRYTSAPGIIPHLKTKLPALKVPTAMHSDSNRLEFDEFSVDIYEWLSLIRLQSPRVAAGDDVDRYISTYVPPGLIEDVRQASLCKMTWEGFMPASWTQYVLAEIVLAVPAKHWFALSATAFVRGTTAEATEWTLMRPPDSPGEYLLWDVHGHS